MTEDGSGGQGGDGGGGIGDGLIVKCMRMFMVLTVMTVIKRDDSVSSYHEGKHRQW